MPKKRDSRKAVSWDFRWVRHSGPAQYTSHSQNVSGAVWFVLLAVSVVALSNHSTHRPWPLHCRFCTLVLAQEFKDAKDAFKPGGVKLNSSR
jgi:hypothetical protein